MKVICMFLINVFILVVITKIWMIVAKYIGEQLGVAKFINYVLALIKGEK